jgi:hypothetical protein
VALSFLMSYRRLVASMRSYQEKVHLLERLVVHSCRFWMCFPNFLEKRAESVVSSLDARLVEEAVFFNTTSGRG